MLDTVCRIQRIVAAKQPNGHLPYGIEPIRQAVIETTGIDRIELIEFDDPDNPMKGRYERYEGRFGVYDTVQTKVDIYHAKDLNFCWTRYVICKELCQALEHHPLAKTNTPEQLEELVRALRLPPKAISALSPFRPFTSEKMAEFLAMELLCPVADRKKILPVRSSYSDMHLATEFRVPVKYIPSHFDSTFIAAVEAIFAGAEKGRAT